MAKKYYKQTIRNCPVPVSNKGLFEYCTACKNMAILTDVKSLCSIKDSCEKHSRKMVESNDGMSGKKVQ